MLVMETTNGPTLTAGAVDITFSDFEAVADPADAISPMVYLEGPLVSDRVFCLIWSVATNVVTVTVYKMQLSATNTWGVAVTSDLANKDLTVLADCY